MQNRTFGPLLGPLFGPLSGLSARAFKASRALGAFFRVLSLSEDRDGAVYVSTMEARDYPITATQWHPEKVRERVVCGRKKPSCSAVSTKQ
jgi:hypothetical protein